jgi:ferritin
MLTKNLGKALNRQLISELNSAYVYLNLSARLEYFHVPSAAKWMRERSREELQRAAKLLDFLISNGYDVNFERLDKPLLDEVRDPEAVFRTALKQENSETDHFRKLSELAVSESDFPAFHLVSGFAAGQAAAERKLRTIVEKFHIAGDSADAKHFLDSHFPDL